VRNVSASNLDCTICRELLVATHTLACGHMFCGPCLAQWLEVQAHPSCPSCRTAVESELMLVVGRGVLACQPCQRSGGLNGRFGVAAVQGAWQLQSPLVHA